MLGWNFVPGTHSLNDETYPTFGKNSFQRWCEKLSPGGRPSIGPRLVRGLRKGFCEASPPKLVKSVWYERRFAIGSAMLAGNAAPISPPARGVGVSGTGSRGRSRFMGWLNFWVPNSGVLGTPVLSAAKELRAKGLNPFLATTTPPAVKIPHLMRSRFVISPWESAFTISARLFRASCASFWRRREAFGSRYMYVSMQRTKF